MAHPEGCEMITCPSENGQWALHLPNPLDCASFCKCDWGVAYYMACPDGLHFNAELQVCDWPANAGCTQPDEGAAKADYAAFIAQSASTQASKEELLATLEAQRADLDQRIAALRAELGK